MVGSIAAENHRYPRVLPERRGWKVGILSDETRQNPPYAELLPHVNDRASLVKYNLTWETTNSSSDSCRFMEEIVRKI